MSALPQSVDAQQQSFTKCSTVLCVPRSVNPDLESQRFEWTHRTPWGDAPHAFGITPRIASAHSLSAGIGPKASTSEGVDIRSKARAKELVGLRADDADQRQLPAAGVAVTDGSPQPVRSSVVRALMSQMKSTV
jgi:hypothetical protein